MGIIQRDTKLQKNIARVRKFSSIVEKQLEKSRKSDEAAVENLTFEELRDLDKLLQITSFLLCKYENKREVYSLLKDFASMARSSTDSIGVLDDQIGEMALGADDAIKRIRELQSDVSSSYTVDAARGPGSRPPSGARAAGIGPNRHSGLVESF